MWDWGYQRVGLMEELEKGNGGQADVDPPQVESVDDDLISRRWNVQRRVERRVRNLEESTENRKS
jgi:hypothetical protein